jgi:hypothetical protein
MSPIFLQPRLTHQQTQTIGRLHLYTIILFYAFYGFFSRDPWKNDDVVGFTNIYKLIQIPLNDWKDLWALPSLHSSGDLYYILSAIVAKLLIVLNVRIDHSLRIATILFILITIYFIWISLFKLAQYAIFKPYEYPLGGHANIDNYATCIADMGAFMFCACIGASLRLHETTPFIFGMLNIAFVCQQIIYARYKTLVLYAVLFVAYMGIFITPNILAYTSILNFNIDNIYDKLKAFISQYPTFTWPALPLAIYTAYVYRFKIIYYIVGIFVCIIGLYIFASSGNQAYFLYTLPPVCILAGLGLVKLPFNVHKAIINFSMVFFSILLITIWGIWLLWYNKIIVLQYLYYLNLSFTWKALIYSILVSIAWLFMLIKYRHIWSNPYIWSSAYIMCFGLVVNWMLIVHLWMPTVNQAKTYRGVFNKINTYVGNSCVSIQGLKKPQIASLLYMAKFKIEKNCPFVLSYQGNVLNTNDLTNIKPNADAVLIWQGSRLLDKTEQFYLWEIFVQNKQNI